MSGAAHLFVCLPVLPLDAAYSRTPELRKGSALVPATEPLAVSFCLQG